VAKVTAIVSAYYAEKFLEGRLDNLLAQSEKPEIIVVCQDGSTEHEIAKAKDVTLILAEGIPTLYEAWNIAIKAANGNYITSANTDDRLYPKALEKLAKALDDNKDCALAYADVDIVRQIDGAPVQTFRWGEGGLADLLNGCFIGPMPMWRKSLHDKHGYFLEKETLLNGEEYKYQVTSDYEFWMRLAKGGEKFYHIKQVLGAYLRHENNLEHRHSLRSIWENGRVKALYRKEFEPIP